MNLNEYLIWAQVGNKEQDGLYFFIKVFFYAHCLANVKCEGLYKIINGDNETTKLGTIISRSHKSMSCVGIEPMMTLRRGGNCSEATALTSKPTVV